MNYYNILEISGDATLEEIKRAYRRKAKMLHPDIYKGTDAKVAFQEINEAYHTLINYDKRHYYNVKQKYNAAQYRKYGINHEKRECDIYSRYYNNSYYSYSNAEAREKGKWHSLQTSASLKYWDKITDKFLFCIMLLIGIAAIMYGVKDLFFSKWKGINNLTGFAFGISYTCILLYGWYLRSKSDKKHIKTDFI